MPQHLRIAVQSNGRLSSKSLEFLHSCGLEFPARNRNLLVSCTNIPANLLFIRDDDIPVYVARGVADFGIVGENVVQEVLPQKQNIVCALDFGYCSLVIAVPERSKIKHVQDLEGERIATSYPQLLGQFLKKQGVTAAIITLTGSVEIAPELNLADAICDLTQTGTTLREHNLRIVHTLLQSKAVVIQSPFTKKEKDIFLQNHLCKR
jgi:ATP phosphoribosyltransferase